MFDGTAPTSVAFLLPEIQITTGWFINIDAPYLVNLLQERYYLTVFYTFSTEELRSWMTASMTMKTFSEWFFNMLNSSGFDWISSIPIPLNCTKKLFVSGYLSNISMKASVGPISEKLQKLVRGLENSVDITFQEFLISFLCFENISVDSSSIILSLEQEHRIHIVNLSKEPNILK